MQKDFKIGLAIGVTLAAGAILWLATLPNLSARARALEAASNANPSPKTSPYVSPPVSSPQSTDGTPASSIENRVSPAPSYVEGSIENPDTNDAIRTTNNEQLTTSSEPAQRIHIVQKGDTLSSISAKYYGSSRQWRKIVAANRSNLPYPNHLVPGAKLIIPN
jgi:nucleoid-associated protein YgaU